MEAINFIKKYNKPYIGVIDEKIQDEYGNNYFYYFTLYNPITKFLMKNYNKHIKKLDITELFKKYQNENDIIENINYNNKNPMIKNDILLENNIDLLITDYFDNLEIIYESNLSYKNNILKKYLIVIFINNMIVDKINVNLPIRIIKNVKINNIYCYWIHTQNSRFNNLNINMNFNNDNRLIDNGNIINNCIIKKLTIQKCNDTININNSNIETLNIKNYEIYDECINEKIIIKNSKINKILIEKYEIENLLSKNKFTIKNSIINKFKLIDCPLQNTIIKNNQINLLNLTKNYNKNNYLQINNNNEIKNLIFSNDNFNLDNINLNIINNKKVILKNTEDFNKKKYKCIKINSNIFYYNENEFIIICK